MRTLSHLYIRLSDSVERAANARLHALARQLNRVCAAGVTDVIPGYVSLLIEYDPKRISQSGLKREVAEAVAAADSSESQGALVEVGVVYDGPDLQAVAGSAGMSADEVVKRHSSVTYHAYAAGFTPGFVYLGDVDHAIRHPRLEKPRPVVAAGSVGIADGQTAIYPLDSPGGWNIIGRAAVNVFDPNRRNAALIQAGDRVRFMPQSESPPKPAVEPLNLLHPDPEHPVLVVREPGLLDLMVDEGRFNAGHLGFARSGALDPVSAHIANGLVANRPNDPVIEMNLIGPTLEAVADCVVAFAGYGVTMCIGEEPAAPFTSTHVKAGQVLTFPPAKSGCRGYLAVAGGFSSNSFMGSASVDVRGLIGRPLQEADLLGLRRQQPVRAGFSFMPHSWVSDGPGSRSSHTVRLRLLPGPQYDPELLADLVAKPLRVEHSDRMGVRLETTGAAGGGVVSEGSPLGAVQLTAAGEPLVLLNDRGTMGGYTKPAVVHPRDLPLLAQARDGALVRFVLNRN